MLGTGHHRRSSERSAARASTSGSARTGYRRSAAKAIAAVLLALVGLSVSAGPAAATWSLVAVDEETGKVGVVMASCIAAGILGNQDQTLLPVVLAPGYGAAVAQGTIDPESPAALRRLLSDGAAAREAIDALLEIDEQEAIRQFGVVVGSNQQSGSSAFTGQDVEPERGDRTGELVSVQGVLLADQAVLDRSLSAYTEARSQGREFEQALIDGLVAGSEAGGDRRCGQQTALFAQLAVARPGDDPVQPSTLLTITVDEGDGQNPVTELGPAFAAGRSGWVDIGTNDPVTIPRVAVLAVGAVLAIAAVYTLRIGLGSTAARR